MEYVGLDVHRKNTYFTRMDASGNILHQGSVPNAEILRALPGEPGHAKVAMEATGNWYHLYDLLEEVVAEIYLAHPLKTRVIAEARVKTDKIDSEALAHLLRTDLLPCSYIPPRDVRNLRDLLRYRAALVRVRTGLKNMVHALLAKNGLLKAVSDIFGKRGRGWLASLSLPEEHRLALDGLLAVNDALEAQLDLVSKEIDRRARANPEAMLLTSIPGIAYYSALLIVAEIGDVRRFSNSRRLTAYAGLVPSVRASGGQVRHGHITKQGSRWLRWIMVEAAQSAARWDPELRRFHWRIAKRKGHRTANVALARELLKIVYHLLKEGRTYERRSGGSVFNMAATGAPRG